MLKTIKRFPILSFLILGITGGVIIMAILLAIDPQGGGVIGLGAVVSVGLIAVIPITLSDQKENHYHPYLRLAALQSLGTGIYLRLNGFNNEDIAGGWYFYFFVLIFVLIPLAFAWFWRKLVDSRKG